MLFAEPFFAVVVGDEAARFLFPVLLAGDLALVLPPLVDLAAAVLDAVLLPEDELFPDLDVPPPVLAADVPDADLEDFDVPEELAPDRPLVAPDEVDLFAVDFEADDFFVDEAEVAFGRALAEPELFFADEEDLALLAVFPTVLTTAFAVPTAAPAAAPCKISPTTSFALSYITSRVPLPRLRVDEAFFPPDVLDAVVLLERLFGIARLLMFLRKELSHIVPNPR